MRSLITLLVASAVLWLDPKPSLAETDACYPLQIGVYTVAGIEAPIYWADDRGIFERHGLCPDIRHVPQGGKGHLLALGNQEIDVTHAFSVASRCAESGFSCEIVTTLSQYPDMVLLGRTDGPELAAETTAAVSRCTDGVAGGLAGTILRMFLNSQNLALLCPGTTSEAPAMIALPAGRGPAQMQALAEGSVDFVLLSAVVAAPHLTDGSYRIIANNDRFPSSTAIFGPVMRSDFIAEHPEVVAAYVDALREAAAEMAASTVEELGVFYVSQFNLAEADGIDGDPDKIARMQQFLAGVYRPTYEAHEPHAHEAIELFMRAYLNNPDYILGEVYRP